MLRGPTKVIPRCTHDGAGHAVGEDAALTVVVEGKRDELLVGARTGDMRVGLIAEEVPPQVRQAVVREVRKRKGCPMTVELRHIRRIDLQIRRLLMRDADRVGRTLDRKSTRLN